MALQLFLSKVCSPEIPANVSLLAALPHLSVLSNESPFPPERLRLEVGGVEQNVVRL